MLTIKKPAAAKLSESPANLINQEFEKAYDEDRKCLEDILNTLFVSFEMSLSNTSIAPNANKYDFIRKYMSPEAIKNTDIPDKRVAEKYLPIEPEVVDEKINYLEKPVGKQVEEPKSEEFKKLIVQENDRKVFKMEKPALLKHSDIIMVEDFNYVNEEPTKKENSDGSKKPDLKGISTENISKLSMIATPREKSIDKVGGKNPETVVKFLLGNTDA